ncbi:hypothetical protein LTR67_002750 [Exophiala xenobiotica]
MLRLTSVLVVVQTILCSSLGQSQSLGHTQSFNTTPNHLQIPVVQSTKYGKTEPGYVFVNPLNSTAGIVTPCIFTDDGRLVWYSPALSFGPLRPQTYQNKTVLTTWIGAVFPQGLGWGFVTVLDNTYTVIHNVTLEDPSFQTFNHTPYQSYMDFHESQVTDDGSLLVTALNVTPADISSVGGPKAGFVIDSLFYEIDIATNKVLFSWSGLNHSSQIPLNDSMLPLTSTISGNGSSFAQPWGYFHMNSVAKYGSNYLISSRMLCTLFLIGPDGNVIWRLSGIDGGDFRLGMNTHFCYQHDARILHQDSEKLTITLHDNGDTEYDNNTVSRALALDLDMTTKLVTVNRTLRNPQTPIFAVSQGSYQTLPNGHVLTGHGAFPVIEEFDGQGNITMTFQFGSAYDTSTYRAYKSPWHPNPVAPPVAVAYTGHGTDVYMSWNGATDVESWTVYAGSNVTSLAKAISVPNGGFETSVNLAKEFGIVQVEAVRSNGSTKKSIVVKVTNPP